MLKRLVLTVILCVWLLLLGCSPSSSPSQTVTPTASPSASPSAFSQASPSDAPTLVPTAAPDPDGPLKALPLLSTVSADLNGDGTTEQMSFATDENEVLTVSLQTASKDYSLKIEGCQYEAQYGYTVNGKTSVLLIYDMASSDYVTSIISFNGTALVCTEITGYVTKAENTSSGGILTFSQPLDLFGTWLVSISHTLSDDFLVTKGNVYMFDSDSTVTTKTELTAMDASGYPVTIPPGSTLTLVKTDGKAGVDFIYNQVVYTFEVKFDQDNNLFRVNGMLETDAFVDLEYFG